MKLPPGNQFIYWIIYFALPLFKILFEEVLIDLRKKVLEIDKNTILDISSKC